MDRPTISIDLGHTSILPATLCRSFTHSLTHSTQAPSLGSRVHSALPLALRGGKPVSLPDSFPFSVNTHMLEQTTGVGIPSLTLTSQEVGFQFQVLSRYAGKPAIPNSHPDTKAVPPACARTRPPPPPRHLGSPYRVPVRPGRALGPNIKS